jgi:preprotein translocase subunit Sss1
METALITGAHWRRHYPLARAPERNERWKLAKSLVIAFMIVIGFCGVLIL